MHWVNDPDLGFPPTVAAGERFVVLSDCETWDSTSGCGVYLFLRDFGGEHSPDPNGLDHASLMKALEEGDILNVSLDELVDVYLQEVLIRRRGRDG